MIGPSVAGIVIALIGEGWCFFANGVSYIAVLIALGGGVFTAFMAMTFRAIGIDAEPFFQSWLLPCGAAGASAGDHPH